MKWLVLTILFILPEVVKADAVPTASEFCSAYVGLKDRMLPPAGSLGQLLRLLFMPGSIIQPVHLGSGPFKKDKRAVEGRKILFVQLPHGEQDEEFRKELVHEQGLIVSEPLLKQVQNSKTEAECVSAISADSAGFAKLLRFSSFYSKNQEKIQAAQDALAFGMLIPHLKAFSRHGWEVRQSDDLFGINKVMVSDSEVTEVMLIAHSDENGRIYDSARNPIPKGFFSNLPQRVRKLSIYSCHPEAVINYYEIEKLTGVLDYLYPKLAHGFDSMYGDRIPESSVRGMLRGSGQNQISGGSDRNCSLRVSIAQPRDRVVVLLNDRFVGTIDGEDHLNVSFSCDLLKADRNMVKAFYLNRDEKPAISMVQAAIINSNQVSYALELKEFFSSDRNSHLITIGTTGGIQ